MSTNLPVSLFVSFTCCLWISNKIRINNKRTTKQNVNNDGCFVFNLIFYTSFQMKNHCTGIGQYSLDFPFSLVKNVFVDCLDVLVEFELPVRSNIRSRHDMTPEKLLFHPHRTSRSASYRQHSIGLWRDRDPQFLVWPSDFCVIIGLLSDHQISFGVLLKDFTYD